MKRTHVLHPGAHRQRRLSAFAAAMVALAMLLMGIGGAPAVAQEATPPAQPQQNAAPAAQTTPETAPATNQQTSADDLAPGSVIAQGLVYLDGSTQVFQVVEQKPAAVSSAKSASAGTAFLFQRGGATVVRNDVTGKRTRLEVSEGYYESAGDPYTIWADSSGAVLWNFGLSAPANVAKDAFYESPEIKGISAGTYDLELTRFVLQPGDSVQLPDHNGAALVMPFAGQVNLTVSGSAGVLSAGDGQLVTGNGSVNNQGNQAAGFIFVALGDKVSDQQPENSAPQPAATNAAATNAPAATNNATTTANATTVPNAASTTAAAPATQATAAATQAPTGSERTSIAVTAQADIYVEVTADGVLMFQGNLATGQTTGQIAGSSFTVYTSSGVNTLFTNSCGTDFYMGTEEGEATYYLQAGPESCPPSV